MGHVRRSPTSSIKDTARLWCDKATNANPITPSKGATNGYTGLGASFSISLPPGGEVLIRSQYGGVDIGPTNKTLDLAGSGTEVAEMAIVLG